MRGHVFSSRQYAILNEYKDNIMSERSQQPITVTDIYNFFLIIT